MAAENPCAEFFARLDRKIEDLPEPDVCTAWEALTACPEHSPGPVEDNEELRRRIIYPTHIDTADAPSPVCFSDLWSHGLSADRVEYRTVGQSRADAIGAIDDWNFDNADKPKRSLRGFAIVSVSDLRRLKVNDIRALAIFDTAMPTNSSHADVCAVGRMDKLAKRDLRTSVWHFLKKGLVAA